MFQIKQPPLMSCRVRHSLPGRMRVDCRGLKYLNGHRGDIKEQLEGCAAIGSAAVTVVTGNVLVTYNPEQAVPEDVLDQINNVVGAWSLDAYKGEREAAQSRLLEERRLQEEPISETLQRIGVTLATLAFTWLSPGRSKPGLVGRFLNMPALTALTLSGPIMKNGVKSLTHQGRPNADTLSSSAIVASILAGQSVSALTIILLADIAELLTAYTMERTRKAIRNMLSVGEEHVWRLREDSTEERVEIGSLAAGDRVIVHTGEKVSVDGKVVQGEAAVDQSSITGEFMPAQKAKGDDVFAGTVVKSGQIIALAERVGDKTAVARIISMVEEAAHRKAAVQNTADRFSAQFIPVNFALAFLVYLLTGKASRALNMLIIDYSCGVRLSTATALSAAICTAARNGVLIKGSNYLEQLSEAETVVFDKTGTLTEGRPVVQTAVCAADEIAEKDLFLAAAAAEETSTHPMAIAILDRVRRSGWTIPKHTDNETHTAMGVSTRVGRAVVRVGSQRFMKESGIDPTPVLDRAHRIARKGENVIYVSRGKKLLGVLGVQDVLRDDMKKSLNRMRHLGVDDVILLTGDVEQHAEIVAARMAMDRYHAEVLPDEKAETVLRLQSKGARVVMVGDGINDAPALAYADVGISMGTTRTDIAMEAADITITGDDPLMIPSVVRLAQKTMGIVRQNFATAITVNTLGIMLASIGVLPVFWGAVLHNASTVAVVINSSRLLMHDMEQSR
ncbi:MAG: cation-translocating P-type ATPase [Myxococcota bacterium]|nr:cation-translocating P-type ATPase [Myxococcota bacterium]